MKCEYCKTDNSDSAKLCKKCGKSMVNSRSQNVDVSSGKLIGISGWLALLRIVMILGAAISAYSIFNIISLTSSGNASISNLGNLVALSYLVLGCLQVASVREISAKRKRAKRVALITLAVGAVVALIEILVYTHLRDVGQITFPDKFYADSGRGIFNSAAWMLYLLNSKRVRNTLTKVSNQNSVDEQSEESKEIVSHDSPSDRAYVEAAFKSTFQIPFMSDEAYSSLSAEQKAKLLTEGKKLGDEQSSSKTVNDNENDDVERAKLHLVRIGFRKVNNLNVADSDLEQLPQKALDRYYQIGLSELNK